MPLGCSVSSCSPRLTWASNLASLSLYPSSSITGEPLRSKPGHFNGGWIFKLPTKRRMIFSWVQVLREEFLIAFKNLRRHDSESITDYEKNILAGKLLNHLLVHSSQYWALENTNTNSNSIIMWEIVFFITPISLTVFIMLHCFRECNRIMTAKCHGLIILNAVNLFVRS